MQREGLALLLIMALSFGFGYFFAMESVSSPVDREIQKREKTLEQVLKQ